MRTPLLALATSAALILACGCLEASAQQRSGYGPGWHDQGDGYGRDVEMRAMDTAAGMNGPTTMVAASGASGTGVVAEMTGVRVMDVGAEIETTGMAEARDAQLLDGVVTNNGCALRGRAPDYGPRHDGYQP